MRSFIDTVTIILHDDGDMEWLDDIYDLFEDVGPLQFSQGKFGKNFYKNGGVVTCNGAIFAEVNWGGDSQAKTVQLMLKGLGCGMVPDWTPIAAKLTEYPRAKISRLDLAIDILDGSLKIEEFYELRNDRSLWVGSKGGKPPKFKPYGDPHITTDYGRTIYIGTGDSDLYSRVYEKGMELFSRIRGAENFPNPRDISFQFQENAPAIRVGDYVRFECEFKAKTTIIPFNAMVETDSFMAGAYPYLADLLQNTTPIKRLRVENEVMGDLDLILKQLQKQYGPSLLIGLEKYGPDELLRKILSMHPSPNLIKKGIRFAKAEDTPRICDIQTGEIV